MVAAFSHELRILSCPGCGAPAEAQLQGGLLRCSYCGAESRLAPRDDGGDLARAQQAPAISEMERVARLRGQQSSTGLPSRLTDLVGVDGALLDARFEDAKNRWLQARNELETAPSFAVSERLFYLTKLLVARGNPRQRRAFLETAIELLPDEGHRHILRCLLARYAVHAGELHAAAAWLAGCSARPLELRMDTAYRVAKATLLAARRDYDAVLKLLDQDWPVSEDYALDHGLQRVHALAQTESLAAAVLELERLEQDHGEAPLTRGIAQALSPDVVSSVYRELNKQRVQKELERIEDIILQPAAREQSLFRRRFVQPVLVWLYINVPALLVFALIGVLREATTRSTLDDLVVRGVAMGILGIGVGSVVWLVMLVKRIRQIVRARAERAVLRAKLATIEAEEAG